MTNIFAVASRKKLRFQSNKNKLTVEDLWDIPLDSATQTSINSLFVETNAKLNESKSVGLVAKPSKDTVDLQLRIDILTEIYNIRNQESIDAKQAAANAEHNQRILAHIERKEDEELSNLTTDELRARMK